MRRLNNIKAQQSIEYRRYESQFKSCTVFSSRIQYLTFWDYPSVCVRLFGFISGVINGNFDADKNNSLNCDTCRMFLVSDIGNAPMTSRIFLTFENGCRTHWKFIHIYTCTMCGFVLIIFILWFMFRYRFMWNSGLDESDERCQVQWRFEYSNATLKTFDVWSNMGYIRIMRI